jgi:hypothetical protein
LFPVLRSGDSVGRLLGRYARWWELLAGDHREGRKT